MKILFCDEGYSEARTRLADELPDAEIVAAPRDRVRQHLAGVNVVVPYMARIGETIVNAGTFGLIQQFGVGLESVDVEAATRAGVWVARVPSGDTGNAESVAEHALFLMLALARRFPQSQRELRAGRLGEPAGLALAGKTVCIIGVGAAGSALALRLHALGMHLIAVRKNVRGALPSAVPFASVFAVCDLAQAVAHADFVVVTARYERDAHHLLDATILSAAKQGAYIVNVARGGFVDTDALAAALRSGRIAGAGLDVVENEPIAHDHSLMALDVIVTPHIAGVTDRSYVGIAHEVAENVRRFARGDAPRHAVNNPRGVRGAPVA
ncbi:MAG: NAD(P)-binding domain-containing protein [Candidatus Eremiobacteraeota bacterium]|nr:NAD(P)-binding domain-containing protein [Candidatus Eremiobacteraeota bacterium]